MKPKPVALATLVLLTVLTSSAIADEEYFEPTETQLELNQKGLEALSEGDYDGAIRFFDASVGLGAGNVTYTNLGRAHQRAGNCEEAEKYFQKVFDAPEARTPPPETVAETIARYRDEMREECPGYLDVTCDPAEIDLYIDEDGPKECITDEPRSLLPGHYDVRGEYERQITETTVNIDALQTSRVHLGLHGADVEEPTEDAIARTEIPTPKRHDSTDGWMWLAASGAALAGGLVLDTVPSSANNQQLDATDFVPLGFYGASVTFGVLGIQRLR